MADHYEKATVNTLIPKRLVSTLEQTILRGCGFDSEEDGALRYFFAEDGINTEESHCRVSIEGLKRDKSRLASEVRAFVERHKIAPTEVDSEYLDLVIPSGVAGHERILQEILKKPENRGKKRLNEIVIMAAYTCSKMSPGAFGGWVTRITPGRVQHSGTHDILDKMRKGKSVKF